MNTAPSSSRPSFVLRSPGVALDRGRDPLPSLNRTAGGRSTVARDLLLLVESESGVDAAARLMRFGRFTFAMSPSDHPELFAWEANEAPTGFSSTAGPP
jgi:hypothetical protein